MSYYLNQNFNIWRNKMIKRFLEILLLVLALGLIGCKSNVAKNVDTDSSKTKVEDKSKDNTDVDNNIHKLSNLIDEKKYDEAKALVQELNNKELDESQKVSVDKLKARIDSESAKVKENKNEATQESNKKISKKQEYRTKLDIIGVELKKLDIKDSGTTADMRSAANERYKKWDAALNEIYGVLKGDLSSSDMKKLQNEEIQWISDRDAKAKKTSSEMKGGTMESVIYVNSLADTTKQRCYELVEKYMQ